MAAWDNVEGFEFQHDLITPSLDRQATCLSMANFISCGLSDLGLSKMLENLREECEDYQILTRFSENTYAILVH